MSMASHYVACIVDNRYTTPGAQNRLGNNRWFSAPLGRTKTMNTTSASRRQYANVFEIGYE
jgi:hypothetical protein